MSDPDGRPVDELAAVYRHLLAVLDAAEEGGDDDTLEELFETRLPLPDASATSATGRAATWP